MKTNCAIVSLSFAAILTLTGCGKNENTTPAPAPATPAAKSDTPDPSSLAKNAAGQASNAVASAVDSAKSTVDSAVKSADATPKSLTDVVPPGATPAVPGIAPAATAPPATPDQPKSLIDQATSGMGGLSQDTMVQGLKEALAKGLEKSVSGLGHDGGFLTNLNVKIPMPEKLKKVETALRTLKQDKMADDFVNTMNHAAEQAVPVAASVFADTLKQMTITDAKAILTGPNDAATRYFEKTTQTNLYTRFYPIVQKATEKTGVTSAYKSIVEKANSASSLGSFGSSIVGSTFDKDSLDIDAYVTNKALEGLFKLVADEELKIRQNPVARTTETLQKVFGSLKL